MNKSELIKEKANEVILRFSKHLIAVSSLVQRDLEENYGIPKDNITVVHNGVNLQDFFPPSYNEKEKLQQKYGFDKSKISLLFIGGSAYERKGFRFLCKALPQISKDVTIIAVCRRLSKEYRKILSDNALDERVKIIEYVPNISEIYRAVDIYALPTIYDPFPLATLEAMASGLPVVISSFAGSTDIIKDWKNGIIIDDPRNVMKLATLINKLAESDSMRKFMGSNARETVERLSWSNVARKIMEVYEIAARR
jgi:UDP-glucose:(heptosyl)LPS alpha-1,3-glucosyltransferase